MPHGELANMNVIKTLLKSHKITTRDDLNQPLGVMEQTNQPALFGILFSTTSTY